MAQCNIFLFSLCFQTGFIIISATHNCNVNRHNYTPEKKMFEIIFKKGHAMIFIS